MHKPLYKAQTRPYSDDMNDLIEKGGVGSGKRGHTTGKIVKQPWDESVKDTPEYDVRRHEKKEKTIQAELDKLKAQYREKFGHEYCSKK